MKIIKSLILFILIMSHCTVFSKSVTANDSIKMDSTYVKYFLKDLNNLTLGSTNSWDTTAVLASYYDGLDYPYRIYQTLSNSGLAHKDINFTYPHKLGFNLELPAFSSYLHDHDNVVFL